MHMLVRWNLVLFSYLWAGREAARLTFSGIPRVVKACLLLLVMTNARCRVREVRCDYLEANHLPSGSIQLIAWECRGPQPDWPIDWVMTPCGTWDGKSWIDANGTVVTPFETLESWTNHDPERRAFGHWREMGSKEAQGGVWHEVPKAPFPR